MLEEEDRLLQSLKMKEMGGSGANSVTVVFGPELILEPPPPSASPISAPSSPSSPSAAAAGDDGGDNSSSQQQQTTSPTSSSPGGGAMATPTPTNNAFNFSANGLSLVVAGRRLTVLDAVDTTPPNPPPSCIAVRRKALFFRGYYVTATVAIVRTIFITPTTIIKTTYNHHHRHPHPTTYPSPFLKNITPPFSTL